MKYLTKETINRLLSAGLITLYSINLGCGVVSYIRDEYWSFIFHCFIAGWLAWVMSGCDKPPSSSEISPKIGFGSSDKNDGTIGYKRLD